MSDFKKKLIMLAKELTVQSVFVAAQTAVSTIVATKLQSMMMPKADPKQEQEQKRVA